MAKGWTMVMVLAPAAAAGTAAGLVADSKAGIVAAAAGWLVARVAAAAAARAATEKFLAEAESPVPDAVEIALAARVGLDLGTVLEAKAAVRAAVRAVMVRRGAGVTGLGRFAAAVPPAAQVARAAELARAAVEEAPAEAASPASASRSPAPATASQAAAAARPGRPDDVD